MYFNTFTPDKQPSPNSCLLKTLQCLTNRVRLFVSMSGIGVYTILARTVVLIRSDATYGPQMSKCWLPASTWVEAHKRSGHVDASIALNVRKLNATMSKSSLFGSVMTRFDGSNPTGVFRIDFQHQFFYYFTDQGKQVEYPRPLNGAWKDRVLEAASNVLVIPSIRARPTLLVSTTTSFLESRNSASPDGIINTSNEDTQSPMNKRQRIEKAGGSHQQQTGIAYWPDSPEAIQLFRPRRNISRPVSSTGNDDGGSMMLCDESPEEAVWKDQTFTVGA